MTNIIVENTKLRTFIFIFESKIMTTKNGRSRVIAIKAKIAVGEILKLSFPFMYGSSTSIKLNNSVSRIASDAIIGT